MSVGSKRVVVIQDASRDISLSAIKWAIDGLSLKLGDELTLLGVLHQVNTPSTFPFMAAGKLMGYKSRVDSNSMLGANQKIIDEELKKKEEEYQNSAEISLISEIYETKKITFHRRVVAAASPKVVALEEAKKLRATWIILDRQMKKDKKYFMERLSCGISRMKRNNSIELLRRPIGNQKTNVTYDEMLPGPETKPGNSDVILEIPDDDDLFSLELDPTKISNDNIKEAPEVSTTIPSFSASTSNDNQALPNTASTHDQPNPEILSGSIADETRHFPFQLQEEDDLTGTQRAEDNYSLLLNSSHCKIQYTQSKESIIQETEQKSATISKETLTCGFVNQQLEEMSENPICAYCRNDQPKTEAKIDFTYTELHAATDGFSDENFLSEGGFGSVYKGRLKNRQWVAVKQHKHASLQGEKEFRSEVHVLSKARHENVVMLLGSCSEGSHRLLVYEYVCNRSLDVHLSKHSPNVLSWKHRMNIALGAAKGLNYLHQNNIIHRDMRPNNILINHEYKPLLGDFGLARTQQDESDHLSENKVVGTFGYLAPEYAERGRVSTKTDVYSFGVVLLELITGRTPLDKTLQEKSLVGWARPLLKERKYPELIDERIIECHDVHQLFWMVIVADKCLSKDPDDRPSMEKVEHALKCIVDGETINIIEDFSPARSSVSSLPTSNELIGEQETSTDLLSISSSQTKVTFSVASSEPSCRSQTISKGFEDSIPGRRNSSKNDREKNPTPQVLYDEMLI
uniref:Inactive protein kinase SELMODRAFT_444075 n=1 Tax=Elaeis guineensis var. tenera TaxID=51953 RepID=A0A6J0PDA0_ELAGV|nr:inactive protein kinase SELMODRAFT_444075 [Elaeis guineensis]